MTVLQWVVALCFFCDVLFPPCLAIYALILWRGRWRIAAGAPLLVVIPAAASFLHLRSGLGTIWLLLYVLLALMLSAYSAMVLTLYCNRKPPRA
ncbi:MAG: hypothetical protein ABSH42_20605 [Bryobacteraceae bacterium]|jgi:hypothetical protein